MNLRFVIPLKLEDLTVTSNKTDIYVVCRDYTAREASHLLTEIRDRATYEGPEFILENFDIFYSILVNFSNVELKAKLDAWRIIYKAVTAMVSTFFDMNVSLDSSGSDTIDRRRNCNVLKMLLFVYCTLLELFEDQDAKESSDIEAQNVGKGKKRPTKKDQSFDWSRDREKGIELLLRLFSLSLHQLFTPPVVEDEVVNCVTKCCWKILEKPSTSKNKPLCTNLFHILGITVEKYRQSLSFCLRIVQLLQQKEQLVSVLTQLVEMVVKQNGQRIIIGELLLEVGRIDIRDLSRDSSSARAISAFLTELAERCPDEVLPSVSQVLSYLDEDAYMMRNATLSIIGCLVSKTLSADEMDNKSKNLRDTLLDKLEEHILDTNAFSRGRALQVWSRLCDECKIPLTRLETLIPAVVNRLKDRTSYVRKNAVQFLTSFLKENPFAARLSLQTVQEAYHKEREKLKTMMESVGKEVDEEMNKDDDLSELWNKLEPEVIAYCDEVQSSPESDEDDSDDALNATIISNCSNVDELFKRFRDLMCDKKFRSALKLLKILKDQWASHTIFAKEEVEDDNAFDDEQSNDRTVILPYIVKLCKRVFTETTSAPPSLTLDNRSVVKELEIAASAIIQNASQENTTTIVPVVRTSCSEESIVVEINKQQILVKYLSDCIRFAEEIRKAIPLVCDLLQSRNVTDVQEAINFFVTAFEFGVQGALIGIRKMLPLVFSQEASVKDAVMSAYKNIYLESSQLNQLNSRNKAIAVVKSLTELVSGATVGEEISLEELLKQFMASGHLENSYVQVMWERFAMKIPNTTPEESRIAVLLIAMIANSDSKMIKKNLDTLIDVGLSDRANDDLTLVTNTCIALRKALDNHGRLDLAQPPYRFDRDHKLFSRLSDILINSLQNLSVRNWALMCDEALKVIFIMAENPDSICEFIVKSMVKEIVSNFKTNNSSNNGEASAEFTKLGDNTENIQSQSTQASSTTSNIHLEFGTQTINSEILTRLITFVGSLALNMLIHLEVNIFTELKIRNALKDEKDKRKSINKTPKTPRIRRSLPVTPKTTGDNLEDEIGLGGTGAVEDAEAEFLSQLCDDEIVEKCSEYENLIARLSPVVVAIASDPIQYPDVKLRTAAALSMAKFMAVSEKFCNKYLQLFFTILEKSSESVIRANSVIAVGDLCIRYPNLLDPWTSQLYSPLRDKDVGVRTSALKVLSRLILSDMIKVKGQISEMAILIVDDEINLSSMAKLFFTELGKKQNAIYNVLPDIISHLSDTEVGIEEDDFRTIMKYLFDLIGKERQTVCLVEKLCQRFRMTTNERQWRDLSFCLSLLTFSEKSIAKLYENMICFADKLTNDYVHETLISIINTSRKMPNMKNEIKQVLDEFEHKINECRSKGINEDDSELREIVRPPSATKKSTKKVVSVHKARNPVNQRKPAVSQRKQSSRRVFNFSDDSEEESAPRSAIKNKENPRILRERQKAPKIFDDSDEGED